MADGIDYKVECSERGVLQYTFWVNPEEIVSAVPVNVHGEMPTDDEVLAILETLKRVHLFWKRGGPRDE